MNDFKWTDELVAEFATWSLNHSPAFQGRMADIEQFKSSKTKKDWEIVEFKEIATGIVFSRSPLGDLWVGFNKDSVQFHVTGDPLKKDIFSIHAVRRLSDGQVFRVGDEIEYGIIDGFGLSKNNCAAHGHVKNRLDHEFFQWVENINHVKHPLFRTSDGVDVFEGDRYWWVNTGEMGSWTAWEDRVDTTLVVNGQKQFSTREAAESYVWKNRPVFSYGDLIKFGSSVIRAGGQTAHLIDAPHIESLAKQRCGIKP